jgi:hypothetical protein
MFEKIKFHSKTKFSILMQTSIDNQRYKKMRRLKSFPKRETVDCVGTWNCLEYELYKNKKAVIESPLQSTFTSLRLSSADRSRYSPYRP